MLSNNNGSGGNDREYGQLLEAMSWAADAVRKWAFVTFVIVSGFYAAALIAGCAAVEKGCMVVDAAHAACAVIRYRDASGVERTVSVTRDELVEFGQAVEARKGAKE